MTDLDRMVGGLRCRDVLEQLSAYVDGELAEDEVRQVQDHLMGCDRCERFGGLFGEVVVSLRRELGAPKPVPAEVEARLNARLMEV